MGNYKTVKVESVELYKNKRKVLEVEHEKEFLHLALHTPLIKGNLVSWTSSLLKTSTLQKTTLIG